MPRSEEFLWGLSLLSKVSIGEFGVIKWVLMVNEGVGRRNDEIVVFLGWLGENQGSSLRKVCERLRRLLGMGLGLGSALALMVGC